MSASEKFRFEYITSLDGLTSNQISQICEDERGIYWISTRNGLASYDGIDFIQYTSSEDDTSTIGHNTISKILIDSKNRLWVANTKGLDLYNPVKDNFIRKFTSRIFEPYRNYFVNDLEEYQEGIIILGTDNGILLYDYLNEVVLHHQPPESYEFIATMYELDHNSWLLGTQNGIQHYNPTTGSFGDFYVQQIPIGLNGEKISSIEMTHSGRLMIGTLTKGVFEVDMHTGKLNQYSEKKSGAYHISDDMIKEIHMDAQNRIWISSDQGLNVAYSDQEISKPLVFDQVPERKMDPYGLASNICTDIFEDGKGWIWVGSEYNGLSILTRGKYLFEHYKYNAHSPRSPGGGLISGFEEDLEGNIWMSVDDYGLSKFNPEKRTFQNMPINEQNGLISNKVIQISFDQDKRHLYGATWGGGLFEYDIEKDSYRAFTHNAQSKNSLRGNYLFRILYDENGLWIGTVSKGIDLFNPANSLFKHYSMDSPEKQQQYSDMVTEIYKDTDGLIWFGTYLDGLFIYDDELDSITSDHVIAELYPDNFRKIVVYQITQDEENFYWIATSTGLFMFDIANKTYHRFSSEDGLSSNQLFGIQMHQNTAWISSDNGLSRVDYEIAGRDMHIEVRNFSAQEGVQNKQFLTGSSFKTGDGKLLFGGIDGFNLFDPERIEEVSEPVKVILTGLRLFGAPVGIDDETGILDSACSIKKVIELKHHQNSLGIDYTALFYKAPYQVRFQYMLDGFDENWSAAVSERFVNYSKLPPGSYTFRLKATTNTGEWVGSETSLSINIVPAWWQTIYFKVGVVVLLILILMSIYVYRIRSVKGQKLILEQKVQARTSELNEALKTIQDQKEEIQAQNEELSAQNAEISSSRDQIEELNKHLEKRVIERTKNLLKTNQELDRFVYSASHDLSSPLKSILGLIHISRIEDREKALTLHLDHMEKSISKLEEVIESLAQFSRNSGMEVNPVDFSFDELVAETLDQYCSGLSFKLIKKYEANEIVKTDYYRLKIVIANILTNALKHSDPNKRESVVEIDFKKENNYNLLSFKDNGIGIDGDQGERIFEMFYRASEQSSGSGLGLYIVREMLNKINGSISFDSEVGIGTTFYIKFPDIDT